MKRFKVVAKDAANRPIGFPQVVNRYDYKDIIILKGTFTGIAHKKLMDFKLKNHIDRPIFTVPPDCEVCEFKETE